MAEMIPEMAVTNASVPDKLWSNFVDKVSFISEYKNSNVLDVLLLV